MLDRLIATLPLSQERRALAAQALRFVVTGGFVTLLGAGLYAALVEGTRIHEQGAVFLSYVLCVAIGYGLHSRWSFAGHGERTDPRAQTLRFITVSLVSYALNAAFTWALVRWAGLPRWSPVIPILFVTPLVTFTLNRQWVFR